MPLPDGTPSPLELWAEARGHHGRYRDLMRQHGHLDPEPIRPESLPCSRPAAAEVLPPGQLAALDQARAEARDDLDNCRVAFIASARRTGEDVAVSTFVEGLIAEESWTPIALASMVVEALALLTQPANNTERRARL